MYSDQSRFTFSFIFVASVICALAVQSGGPSQPLSTEAPTTDDADDDGGVERPNTLFKLPEYKRSTSTKSSAVDTTRTVFKTTAALTSQDPEKGAETLTATETSTKTIKAATETSTNAVKTASMDGWGGSEDITWLYILVASLALILLVLVIICLCLLCWRPKGPYEPKIHSAKIDIIGSGSAKPMFVDGHGKAFSVEGTPRSIPSPKSFQL